MASIKKLAGETAIYGASTILARMVNFLFVPLYTREISTSNYGIFSEYFAYIAILQVFLTFGMETGFFRHANKEKDPKFVLSTTLTWISFLSVLFFLFTFFGANQIASLFGRPEDSICIIFIGATLCFDSITAIMFSKQRFEHKAVKFATFKTIKIFSELGFNLLFFLCLPAYFAANPDSFLLNFLPATPGYQYIIFAIFLSSLVAMLLFLPSFFKIKFRFSVSLWKQMMLYSIPVMIAGLPGAANDAIDRILFRYLAPQPPGWEEQLGMFSANVKLAVIMSLFVQMFRYAAEPFFFANAQEKNIRKTYADVMKYFSVFCIVVFLGLTTNIDLLSLILGRDFRSGIDIVPIMLMAHVLLGISFNLSMCFKLSGKTQYTIYITLFGLLITLVVNLIFMPLYGYYAAAWGHLLSYLGMVVLSWWLGRKVYSIPYDWKNIAIYFITGIALFFGYRLLDSHLNRYILKLAISIAIIILFCLFFLKNEKIKLR
ncbi:MAG: oligosaccharide flippase family protein [Prevotellaceae bacterium]|nr:oligosaccharide flippase family protein [Prevotellaceae bacterium]